jgi:hypothetical protein
MIIIIIVAKINMFITPNVSDAIANPLPLNLSGYLFIFAKLIAPNMSANKPNMKVNNTKK